LRHKRCWISRRLTGGRPGDRIEGRSARSAGRDFGLATTPLPSLMVEVLRRPLESVQGSSPAWRSAASSNSWESKRRWGSVGDCFDHALIESFFAALECELIDQRHWRTWEEARLEVFWWIQAVDNRTTRRSALGYLSPVEHEAMLGRHPKRANQASNVTSIPENRGKSRVRTARCRSVGQNNGRIAPAPTETRHVRSWGSGAPRRGPCRGKADPAGCPDKRAPRATALLGALAGSGPWGPARQAAAEVAGQSQGREPE
jgi:hypothetical protein